MKKNILSLILAATALLSACGGGATISSQTFFAMDTIMEIECSAPNSDALVMAASKQVHQLDALLSVTKINSEIYAANGADGAATAISAHTGQIISQALALCARTGGALDVTIYPVVRAWGFTTGQHHVPDEAQLEALLEAVDYTAVDITGQALRLPRGAMLDLGSVAKGYCGDVVAAQLRDAGVTSAILKLGGNIHTVGPRPDGSPWKIAVKDPLGQDYLGTLAVEDQAVVTSGGYERYFEQDGQTYWHILDPATGRPADSGLISVTVVSGSGILCDGLSTALFVMGEEKAIDHYRQYGDFEAILVTSDGRVVITPGLEQGFALQNQGYTLTVVK